MSRNDDVEQAKNFVERAERVVQRSGLDPDDIVDEIDIENLAPMDRLHLMNLVLRKLQLADVLLACEESVPDPENPNDYFSFKTNGTVLVVYEDGKPKWHMERHDEEWKNYRFYIAFTNIEDVEYKKPEMRLAQVGGFIMELKEVDNEVKECDGYFPNPFNLDGDYRFKKNENFMVAYSGDNPVWYLKREDDEWKMHKMTISREPITDSDSIEDLLRELEGDLDEWEDELDDFDED